MQISLVARNSSASSLCLARSLQWSSFQKSNSKFWGNIQTLELIYSGLSSCSETKRGWTGLTVVTQYALKSAEALAVTLTTESGAMLNLGADSSAAEIEGKLVRIRHPEAGVALLFWSLMIWEEEARDSDAWPG